MNVLIFIALLFSRVAFGQPFGEGAAREKIHSESNALAATAELGLPLNLSSLAIVLTGLALLVFSMLFFSLSHADRNRRHEMFFALTCLSGALLAALGCPDQIGFFLGIAYKHDPRLLMYLEGGLLTFSLLCLYDYMDLNFFRRSRPSVRLGILALNGALYAFQIVIPPMLLMFTAYLQGALFILLVLYLFKRREARLTLTLCVALIAVAVYEVADRGFALAAPPPPWTPFVILLLALSRATDLKPIFAFDSELARARAQTDAKVQTREERQTESGEPLDDTAIVIELNQRSLEGFSVFMDALHNGLMHLSTNIQKSLSRDDQRLKDLYIQTKTLEEGARLLGFRVLSKKCAGLSATLVKHLQDPTSQWNPLILNQAIDAMQKCAQHYLRINSKVLGRRLEYASKVLFNKELNNLEEEDPSLQLPELMQAAGLAKESFETIAWSPLALTIEQCVRDSLNFGKATGTSRFTLVDGTAGAFLLNFDDLSQLRSILSHLVANTVAHGMESSHERQLKNKSGLTHIEVSLMPLGESLVLKFLDDGRGLGILKLREWAQKDRMADRDKGSSFQAYAKLLLVKGCQAPRGFTRSMEAAEKMQSGLELVLFTEAIYDGHCPFALELRIPLARLRPAAPPGAIDPPAMTALRSS